MNAPHANINEKAMALAAEFLTKLESVPEEAYPGPTRKRVVMIAQLLQTTWEQSAMNRTTQIQIIFHDKINEGIHAFPIPRFNVIYPSTETLPASPKKD